MAKRNIIVIGASAGSFEPIKRLCADLPADLGASIFIVWHMSANIRSVMPDVINRIGNLNASTAYDRELIEPNHIYVARPDHHLLLEDRCIRVTKGPKENRFRPAVDPLFRSAAYSHGERVIGVVLSGALDDGTSGLWAVKHHGGLAVVQDPADAEIPSMPENALREVSVDHSVPIANMAELLAELVSKEITGNGHAGESSDLLAAEVAIAAEEHALELNIMKYGMPSNYTCPDCHGVLTELKDGPRSRFRCHTGHAFSPDTLLATITESVEESIWSAIRGIEESIMLLNHLGDHYAEDEKTNIAMTHFKKAREAHERVQILRQAVMDHEHLSGDRIRDEAGNNGGDHASSAIT